MRRTRADTLRLRWTVFFLCWEWLCFWRCAREDCAYKGTQLPSRDTISTKNKTEEFTCGYFTASSSRLIVTYRFPPGCEQFHGQSIWLQRRQFCHIVYRRWHGSYQCLP